MRDPSIILGVESSCDETAVAVLRAEDLPAGLLPDGVRRPANLEDVFVLLTGEELE